MRTPTISVIVATYNSERTIDQCLKSIRSQKYPQEKIEIVIADGGSLDDTVHIAKKYNVQVVVVDSKIQNAEYNKSIGLKNAHNEIAAFIDHDNILPHDEWFLHMVEPLRKHEEVVGVQTLRYQYDPSASLLDRYFALFGAGDPIVWYLGKADRLSFLYDTCLPSWHAIDMGSYYQVQFQPDTMPTIGANGFLIRRKILMENAQVSPGTYFDMDVNIDLIKNGYNTFAFVKDSILHLTGYGSVWYFLKRRLLFLSQYRFSEAGLASKKVRRYGELTKSDTWRLVWVIIICFTFVIPLYDSIRGWRKIRDSAWFLHPFLCFSFVIVYGWVTIRHTFYGSVKKLLGT